MPQDFQMLVSECSRASDEGRMAFGEVVARLIAAGVERYHVDVRGARTYFRRDGLTASTVGPAVAAAVADDFSADGVESAVRASQKGEIGYREFCERIAAAGCPGYMAFLDGQRVLYYGRQGDAHVEYFPGARKP